MSKANPARQVETENVFYTLAVLTLIVAMLGLGGAYAVGAWLDAAREEPANPALTATHLVTIGAQHYVVPAALMSDPIQRRDGFSDRLDMALALPLGAGGRLTMVDVTIMPRGRIRTSANLLDSVYLRQFANAQLQGPPGLVGKPLAGDAGTVGETVWYDPLSPTPFVAKCAVPVAMGGEQKTCIRTVQLSDRNTAVFAFEPSVLDNWRRFDETVESWLAGLRK
ncbi:hypothetical protein [Pelagibacterium limicola]|uniref:hypothetical protein n=1 Tax=Pelagibacterium limicola TaxID=2791022 RepID=UPI0018AFFE8C|nr:hypothetical protein [Pelagibacterium limicola]